MRVWCGRAGLECWRCQDERGHWYVGPKLSDTFHRAHPWMPRNRGSGPTGKAYWSSIRLRKVASSGCCIASFHMRHRRYWNRLKSTNAKYPFWTAKLWEGNITKIWADRMAKFSHSSTVAWAPDMLSIAIGIQQVNQILPDVALCILCILCPLCLSRIDKLCFAVSINVGNPAILSCHTTRTRAFWSCSWLSGERWPSPFTSQPLPCARLCPLVTLMPIWTDVVDVGTQSRATTGTLTSTFCT